MVTSGQLAYVPLRQLDGVSVRNEVPSSGLKQDLDPGVLLVPSGQLLQVAAPPVLKVPLGQATHGA